MSIREYMHGSEGVMFVSDLLRSARPEEPQTAPKNCSIYDRVREQRRRLENERFTVDEKKREAEELLAGAQAPTKRIHIREQRERKRRAAELINEVHEIESGQRIESFDDAVRPYIFEYQRQQFCRPQTSGELQGPVHSCNRVLDQYLVNVEGAVPNFDIQSQDLCPECKGAMQLYQTYSLLICKHCGRSKPFLDATASLLSFSDEYDYCSFSYKRVNHFTEWLASIQAKETLEVPDAVLTTIMTELYNQRIQNTDAVTVHKIRDILKKLKLRKYYEHVQLITCKITGRAPPRMTPEMEEKIKVCFLAASSAFQRHCPAGRKNMISYQLVLLKLCELLGYHDFLPYFMLLKGKDKLSRMDAIWAKMCAELDWSFIPSVP
jgi:hypothetical protein